MQKLGVWLQVGNSTDADEEVVSIGRLGNRTYYGNSPMRLAGKRHANN